MCEPGKCCLPRTSGATWTKELLLGPNISSDKEARCTSITAHPRIPWQIGHSPRCASCSEICHWWPRWQSSAGPDRTSDIYLGFFCFFPLYGLSLVEATKMYKSLLCSSSLFPDLPLSNSAPPTAIPCNTTLLIMLFPFLKSCWSFRTMCLKIDNEDTRKCANLGGRGLRF